MYPSTDPTPAPSAPPSQPPSSAPTWSPTIYCAILRVIVLNPDGLFNSEAYNGEYHLNAGSASNQRAIWEFPNSASNQRIAFSGNHWIIYGANYGQLSHESTANEPPISDMSAEWKLFGLDNIFNLRIECFDSFHPSPAPTTSPTNAPSQPTLSPITSIPTTAPTQITRPPTNAPTVPPTNAPTDHPITRTPTSEPSKSPTSDPTVEPTANPSQQPTIEPTTAKPTSDPTAAPIADPTTEPTPNPTQNVQLVTDVSSQNLTILFLILSFGLLIICLTLCCGLYYSKKSKERKKVIADLKNLEKDNRTEMIARSPKRKSAKFVDANPVQIKKKKKKRKKKEES